MSINIEKFIELAEIHADANYDNPASVKKANAAAETMSVMAVDFIEAGRIEELLGLITHSTAGSWVAFSVADQIGISTEQKERCISTIKNLAVGSSLNSMGAEYWLKERGYDHS
jgi:hypothetical protein